ncbi:MAG: hypothetical protein H6603_11030 [Flavobacteriales bacterium]|nr:hypothetical protein [Flavobacteriales bacterium]
MQENNAGLSNISAAIDTTLEGFQKKVDEMYKDNKAFQKELDVNCNPHGQAQV